MAEDWGGIARSLHFADEREMLESFYLIEEMSISQIAQLLGAGQATIVRRMNINNIQKRGRGGPNRAPVLVKKLFHMDQRLIFSAPPAYIARITRASQNAVYKYKKGVTGGHHGVLCDNTSERPAEVRDEKPNTLAASAGA